MKRVNNTTNTIILLVTMPININVLLFKTIDYITCTVIILKIRCYCQLINRINKINGFAIIKLCNLY